MRLPARCWTWPKALGAIACKRVCHLLQLDLAELVMASAVCIGGPSSAAAIASAKGWRALLIPGLLCGSLGYAIGSFIGVALVRVLR